MDETSENKTIKPPNEDRIDDFLLAALENANSPLASEREIASGMVNHFFTLVIASMGGFVYLVTEKGEQYISWYVLLVGSILLVLGLAVIIRLIKCHFDGKIFQRGRKELYDTIKTRYKETHLYSYYQSIDDFNKEFSKPSFLTKIFLFGGVGVAIALVNCILMFGCVYYLAIALHSRYSFWFGIVGSVALLGSLWFIYNRRKSLVDDVMNKWKPAKQK